MIDDHSTYYTPSPPLKWWESLLGNALLMLICLGFTIVMGPIALGASAIRAIKRRSIK